MTGQAAWRPSLTEAELGRAGAIIEQLRRFGFDLWLGPDGSVLIADLTGKRRTAPMMLTNPVWAHIEAIGAVLDDEAGQVFEGQKRIRL